MKKRKFTIVRVADLKHLIREAVICEEDASAMPLPEENDASLDAQVDRYLTQYEQEAKSAQNEGVDFRTMTRRILNEAGEDDNAEDKGDEASKPPAKVGSGQIDVENFSNSVVRLIDNYDSLLEVRSTLVRRAKNFLSKVYSPDVIDAFERVMREEHGIVPGENKGDVEAEDFPIPNADRAGSGGEGGAPV